MAKVQVEISEEALKYLQREQCKIDRIDTDADGCLSVFLLGHKTRPIELSDLGKEVEFSSEQYFIDPQIAKLYAVYIDDGKPFYKSAGGKFYRYARIKVEQS